LFLWGIVSMKSVSWVSKVIKDSPIILRDRLESLFSGRVFTLPFSIKNFE